MQVAGGGRATARRWWGKSSAGVQVAGEGVRRGGSIQILGSILGTGAGDEGPPRAARRRATLVDFALGEVHEEAAPGWSGEAQGRRSEQGGGVGAQAAGTRDACSADARDAREVAGGCARGRASSSTTASHLRVTAPDG